MRAFVEAILAGAPPILSATYPVDQVGEAAYQVHHNRPQGKIGVRCLAPEGGLSIDDADSRHAVGEQNSTRYRRC